MRKAAEKKYCRHCEDTIPPGSYCGQCHLFMEDQCSACHDELVHDQVKIQNINTHGGRKMADARRTANRRHTIETRRIGDSISPYKYQAKPKEES